MVILDPDLFLAVVMDWRKRMGKATTGISLHLSGHERGEMVKDQQESMAL